jgi:hypothetical protein
MSIWTGIKAAGSIRSIGRLRAASTKRTVSSSRRMYACSAVGALFVFTLAGCDNGKDAGTSQGNDGGVSSDASSGGDTANHLDASSNSDGIVQAVDGGAAIDSGADAGSDGSEECEPSATECGANNNVLTCTSAGTWPTSGGEICNSQTCVATSPSQASCAGVCAPGQTECGASNNVLTCSSAGTWPTSGGTTCNNQTCVATNPSAASCAGVCAPGQTECGVGNNVLTCSSAGAWPTSGGTTCTNQACIASNSTHASCGGSCAPGQTECGTSNNVLTCSSAGAWPISGGTTCNNQTCVEASASEASCAGVCAPGETDTSVCTQGSCNGQYGNPASTRVCNPSGSTPGAWGACSAAINQATCSTPGSVAGLDQTCEGLQCPNGPCSAPTPQPCADSNDCGGYTCGGGCISLGGLEAWQNPPAVDDVEAVAGGANYVCDEYAELSFPPPPRPTASWDILLSLSQTGCSDTGTGYIAQASCSTIPTNGPGTPCSASTCVSPACGGTLSPDPANGIAVFNKNNFNENATQVLTCPYGATLMLWKLQAGDSSCTYSIEVTDLSSPNGQCQVF